MKQIIYVSSEKFGLTISVTSDNIIRDHIVLLDLVDLLALPELLHIVKGSLLLRTPVVLVENLLLTLLALNVRLSHIKKLIFWNWNCLRSLHFMQILPLALVMSDEFSM